MVWHMQFVSANAKIIILQDKSCKEKGKTGNRYTIIRLIEIYEVKKSGAKMRMTSTSNKAILFTYK